MAFKMKGSPMKRNFGIGADSPVKQSKQHKKEVKQKQKSDDKYLTDLNKKRFDKYQQQMQHSSDSLNVANQNWETQQMYDYRTMTSEAYKKKYGKNAVHFSPNKMTEDSPFQQATKDEIKHQIKNRKKKDLDEAWGPIDEKDIPPKDRDKMTPKDRDKMIDPPKETEKEREERIKRWNELSQKPGKKVAEETVKMATVATTARGKESSPNKQKFVRNIKRNILEGQHERRTKKYNKRKAKYEQELAEANEWKELYGTEKFTKKGKSKGYTFDNPSDEKHYRKEAKQASRAAKKTNKSLKKLNKTTSKLNKLNKRSERKGDFTKKVIHY